MAKAAPFVYQRSSTEGTADFELVAAAGFRTFLESFPGSSGVDPFYYCIRDRSTGEYENGEGYLDGSGNLVRANILESSNGGAVVDFGAGLKDVTCDVPAIQQEKVGEIEEPFTSAEKTKLSGIATGATANATNAFLLDRANHTGTQTAATISDFGTATDARIGAARNAANGVAPLDAATKLPVANLPDVAVISDPTGISGADAITNIVSLTQAEYDAIGAPSATTLYYITD